jgi:hypothetical protein
MEKILKQGGTLFGGGCYPGGFGLKEDFMRGVLLWLIGIPIPVIILLYLFNVV